MLIALLDFLNYRSRRGRFSAQSLEASGRKLATESNFKNWRGFPVGTVMFSTRMSSAISWLIMYADDAIASHCAVVVKEGELLDVTGHGVHSASISEYFDGESYLVFYDLSAIIDSSHAEETAKSFLGQRYGYHRVFLLAILLAFGRHATFAWRLIIDILLLGILLAFLWNALVPNHANIPAYLLAVYSAILSFNLMFYRPQAVQKFSRPISAGEA